MPRAERIKKTTTQELAYAASQPGQSKLSTSFFKHEKVQTVEDTTISRQKDDDDISLDNLPAEESAMFLETWVKSASDFTVKDRKESENRGRYCKQSGSPYILGFAIIEKQRRHSVQYAALNIL